jgi:prepilin-type N-terminal cleavage/methylation domain-containing protein
MSQYNILRRFTKKTGIINRQKRSNTMRNKTPQSGFTLIELIAVMVILGILAAVIIPRISTLTQGAYESNVRSMFGVIKNEVNAQAIKAAMSGGSGGHRERFPDPHVGTARNYYLDKWVDEYDNALWAEMTFAGKGGFTNTNKKSVATHIATPDYMVLGYFPHGIHTTGPWSGSSTDEEDVYWIYYMPITTLSGTAGGYDFDGFMMFATQDADMDQVPDATITIAGDGTMAITANDEDIITDIQYISDRDPDS